MTARLILTRGIDALEGHATRFTTGALARNQVGRKVAPNSPHARQWCAIGLALRIAGLSRIPGSGPVFDAVELLDRAATEQGFLSAMRCADERGHVGAVTMFKHALALSEATS